MVTTFPFVGRAEERARLLAHIGAAADGRGGLVLVGGEAGAGKTALIRTVLAADANQAVTGRCPSPDETPPFGPWGEVVQRLHRDLGWSTEPLPPPLGGALHPLSTYELAGSLAHWLGHRGRPLVLVLEDLHWADAASLDLLRHLAPQLSDWPVLVISTYRTDELSHNHPLWHLLPELQRVGAARILLNRLARAEVAELVNLALPPELPQADSVADLLHERTAGLALFVREMVDLVSRTGQVPGSESPLPQTLQQAIDSKLARLSPGTLTALEAAAVIGEQFSFDSLAQVSEMAEDDLSESLEAAITRHVIRPQDATGTQFAFDHALFRESLLARLIGSRRRRWHARIASALMERPEGDLDAIAHHLTRAGDPRATEHLVAAGDRARRLGALSQACERYEQALALLPLTHTRRPEVLLKLAWSLRWWDPIRARTLGREAAESAEVAGDPAVALWVRQMLLTQAAESNARLLQEEATALVADQEAMMDNPYFQCLEVGLFGGLAGYPRAAPLLVGAFAHGGAPEKARALLQAISSRALAAADADLLFTSVILALLDGRLDEAADLCHRAALLALRLRRYRDAVGLVRNELMIRLIGPADEPDQLDRLAQQLRDLEEEAWQQTGYTFIKRGFSLAGFYLWFRGDREGARHHVVEAARQDPRAWFGALAWNAGFILLHSGDAAGARPFAEAVPPIHPDEPVAINTNLMVMAHTLRAEVYLALGETELAQAWLEAADRWPALSTAPFYRANVRLAWAAWWRAAGDLDAAWRAAQEGLADARSVSSSLGMIRADRLLGELATARGDGSLADEHFERSLTLAERCRFPLEAALTRQARGSAPQPAASPPPGRLTERESEVAALVCQGLTDREIGARLFISPKTVDRHLRNIFNKTGVGNRAALAAYAVRHGLLR